MICESRQDMLMYGEICDVKEIMSVLEPDFRNKYGELHSNGYRIIWRGRNSVTMRNKWKSTDIVILTCKARIRKEWYEERFVEVNDKRNERGEKFQ